MQAPHWQHLYISSLRRKIRPDMTEFKYEALFPGGRKRALTLSYDDGMIYDRQLVDMFDRYKLKATFHLSSGKLGSKAVGEYNIIVTFKEFMYRFIRYTCILCYLLLCKVMTKTLCFNIKALSTILSNKM